MPDAQGQRRGDHPQQDRGQRERAEAAMAAAGLSFPLVGKPDIGCRGAGVKLLRDGAALEACLARFPAGGALMLQQLSDWEAEPACFYVRDPERSGAASPRYVKYTPYVVVWACVHWPNSWRPTRGGGGRILRKNECDLA